MKPYIIAMAFAAAAATSVIAAERTPIDFGALKPVSDAPCLTPQQRERIWNKIRESRERLRGEGKLPPADPTMVTLFDWPMRAASNLTDFGYHGISNFVDQDPDYPDHLLDYNCGDRTYDLDTGYNHQGIDYFSFPFSWYKMDNSQVEIVAAAPGIILGTDDGNDDRSCGFGGGDWNAVYIQHADGSVAWYGHMKMGSPTTKGDGEPVAAGEYLGIVGSSGNSTGPHLHFEVYDSDDNLIEPYFGPCNVMNDQSWWISQRPYYDSAINALLTHSADPVYPPCPQQETPNIRDAFAPGMAIYFGAYYRDQLLDQETDYSVLRPDASVQWSWSASSSEDHYAASWWIWDDVLPGDAPEGTWTFRAEYEGNVYDHPFTVCADDNTGPDVVCPDPVTVECVTGGGTPADDPQLEAFFAGFSATDNCDLTVALSNDAPDFFPLGETIVTFTATDDFGNQSSCQSTVTVEDTTAPTIEVTLNRYDLWPPNHKMSTITADVSVSDICDVDPTFALTSVTSNEPDNGLGDGDTEDDIQGEELGAADTEIQLRSERAGGGEGRVYTIEYTVTDESGNTATATVEVHVPHDQGGNALAGGGFKWDGTDLDAEQEAYTLVILGQEGAEADGIVLDRTYVGNHVGALTSLTYRYLDVNHDDWMDLELGYSSKRTLDLRDASGPDYPVGMHYRHGNGTDYAIENIFALTQVAGVGAESDARALTFRAVPNPFRRSTQLSYTVPGGAGAQVDIGIYNVAGQRIRQLVHTTQNPGVHTVTWDGRSEDGRLVPAGVYLQRSLIGGEARSQRLVIIE